MGALRAKVRHRRFMRAIAVFLAALTLAGPVSGQPTSRDTWTDADLGRSLVEGAATARDLWVRGSSGTLVHFDRVTAERHIEAEDVLDLLADGPHLWVLISTSDFEGLVRDIRDPDFADQPVHFGGTPIALFATGGTPGILTTTQVLLPQADRWITRRLAGDLEPGAHVSALAGDVLLVGYNRGEWGGGLRRVDISSGAISFVRELRDDRCAGRLNPACHPVVGVGPDEQDDACALVGSSLSHLGLRYGEVLRVCGNEIAPMFSHPLPAEDRARTLVIGGTWPFDSFVALNDGWIAVGQDGFARARDGEVNFANLPQLHDWAGLSISEPLDGVLFLQAACCWGSEAWVQRRVIAIPVDG